MENKTENAKIEFKESFDTKLTEAWVEIIKDIVAIANSGGGVIIFGLNKDGQPSGNNIENIISLDPAKITDKIKKYTGTNFADFEITEYFEGDNKLAALLISGINIPLVFEKPGTYPVKNGKQKRAFSQGTVYFRHGAKSEPGQSDDIRKSLERNLKRVREQWIDGVRKVIEAPPGSQVAIIPAQLIEHQSEEALNIKIVYDKIAPAYRVVDPDIPYPYRQKELIDEVNKKLPEGVSINQYDILSVRRVFETDKNRDFCYEPKYSSNQYSVQFVNWIAKKYKANNKYFQDARNKYTKIRRSGTNYS